jgi:light-regulated signal transduction histidine kinase (bacteriophytochrome)
VTAVERPATVVPPAAPDLRRIEEELARSRQTEEALRRTVAGLESTVRELEQFAYITSHDLQAPLRSVAGFAQLLTRRYGDRLDGDARDFLGYIEQSVQQMQALIRDLLRLSRLGREGTRITERPLEQALRSAQEHLGPRVQAAGLIVDSGPLPVIRADHGLLAQLFEQLLDNAIKFRHPERPPRVRVEVERCDQDWHITVTDNGIGIATAQLENIFLVFRKLQAAGASEGSGIGLALCRKIASLHGGRIWASAGEGGTRIHLSLPLSPVAAGPQAVPARLPDID